MTLLCHVIQCMIVTSNKGGHYHMEYEIVNLDKKIVVGVGAYTSNDDPNMGQVIGDFFRKAFVIPFKIVQTSMQLAYIPTIRNRAIMY